MTITERIDRITAIAPEYRRVVCPPPKSVKIELTARCNFSCSFCARSDLLRDQNDMDRALFERLVKEMHAVGVEELGLFYLGESMLVRWLDEAVRYAKRIGYDYVFLTTNGSAATAKRLDGLFRAGLDSLKFSLNYCDREQFEQIARSDPKLYDLMMRNIKAARDVRDQVERETAHRCGLYASYIEYDGEQKHRMEKLVEEMRQYVDEIYALPLYSQAGFTHAEESAKGWDVTAGNRGRSGALREPIPCWAVFTEGHITYDGKLSACCFDHDGRFEMGDLTKESFITAWNSPKFCDLRAAHLAKDVSGTVCEKCVAYS